MNEPLTQERLMQILLYLPEEGKFFSYKKKKIVGTKFRTPKSITSYIRLKVDGKHYLAHRLAFLYMLGRWPIDQVDHENGNGMDNRWSNLRGSTNSQNKANRTKQSNNTSGHKGVYWSKVNKRFYASIKHNGKNHYLGCFADIEPAIVAYKSAAAELHGEFARAE